MRGCIAPCDIRSRDGGIAALILGRCARCTRFVKGHHREPNHQSGSKQPHSIAVSSLLDFYRAWFPDGIGLPIYSSPASASAAIRALAVPLSYAILMLLFTAVFPRREPPMQLVNYHQPSLNCTMLGIVRAAADYYGLNASTPALYGASGHAFLMNIHKELCPSGPYCWTMEPFLAQLAVIGLVMSDLGFFGSDSTPTQRAAVEAQLKRALDAGIPCSLLDMENQCISGYDETGFITAQPWPGLDFPPAHLTYGSWSELGEVHISYFTLAACPPAPTREAIRAGLRYARDLRTPRATFGRRLCRGRRRLDELERRAALGQVQPARQLVECDGLVRVPRDGRSLAERAGRLLPSAGQPAARNSGRIHGAV